MSDQGKATRYDDEIDLRDLARTLIRRKWVILGTAVVCLAIALVYGVTRPSLVAFTTKVEIGQVIDSNGEVVPVDSVSDIKSKLENIINQASMQQDVVDGIALKVSNEDFYLLITSQGVQNRKEEHVSSHHVVTNVLLEQLHDLEKLRNVEYEQALENISTKIWSSIIEIMNLEMDLKLLQAEQEIRSEELLRIAVKVDEIDKKIDNPEVKKDKLLVDDDFKLVQLRSERRAYIRYRAEMEVDLSMTTKSAVELQQVIQAKERELSIRERDVTLLQSRRSNLHPSRVLIGPGAATPIPGRGIHFFAALGLVAGGMLGVFGAFFAEFVSGLREPEGSA